MSRGNRNAHGFRFQAFNFQTNGQVADLPAVGSPEICYQLLIPPFRKSGNLPMLSLAVYDASMDASAVTL